MAGNISEWRSLPARPAQTRPLPENLQPPLANALRQQGIHSLYLHQALAWQHASQGQHVVIVTPTASGKTLCYNLPILDRLLRSPKATALYLFPTKALAQDQLAGLGKLANLVLEYSPIPFDLPSAIYDGDTPQKDRPKIRRGARLVLTNPDMLHLGILPHHTQWVEFLTNLQFVVIDEMHTYRGVFGSHVANVLRRLKRVAQYYGAQPQFILTSATIANPVELAEGLIEEKVSLVDEDGAARGPRNFLIYNPPITDPQLGLRRSALLEGVRLAEDLLAYHIQTILFGRSRRMVEILLTYLRQRPAAPLPYSGIVEGENDEPALEAAIRGYRSGYLPGKRREIERGLRQGEVRLVAATNALELGIDIGSLEAAILVGYPGSIASTWQQAGRAGRGEAPSMAVLVATPDPLDQYLASHPDYFFGRSPEHALINPDNLLILLHHLRYSAFELPFQASEGYGKLDSASLQEMLDFLKEEGVIHQSGGKYFWMADQYPAQNISLRSASASPVILQALIQGVPSTIGQVDTESATWMVHPQSIYLHEGQSYLVEELDLDKKLAVLQPANTDYYTEPRSETSVELLEKQLEEAATGGMKALGEIRVTSQVIGFRKLKWFTHELLGYGDLDLPPTELLTTGYWLALAPETVSRLREQGMWNNDPNEYGPDWPAQRLSARRRDSYRCQSCGLPERGREHDVHHKTPFRSFSSFLEANRLENLVTLCPACHRRVETAVRMRSGLAGLAHVMGHLAPFSLMCDPRDLGVHSDPQSPLAGGQPAVLLYDRVPAGIGFSQRLYELHGDLIQRAVELVTECPCADGCPSCTGPGGEQGQGGKRETLALLQALSSA